MNRIKLDIPGEFVFSAVIPIRIGDLNYGNHVGNDTFLALIHEARMQFLQHHGYSELSFEGVGLIMADAAIEFRKELYYGQTLEIRVAAMDFDRLGFDLYYQMEVDTPVGKVVAGKAKTGMMCYDYTAGKRVSLPEAAKRRLSPER